MTPYLLFLLWYAEAVVEAHQLSVAKLLREALGKARDQRWLMKTAGRCFCHRWTVSVFLLGAPVTLLNLLSSFHRAPRARARSLDAGEFHSMRIWCLNCSRSTRVATCLFESLRPFCAVRAAADARERAREGGARVSARAARSHRHLSSKQAQPRNHREGRGAEDPERVLGLVHWQRWRKDEHWARQTRGRGGEGTNKGPA